MNWKYISRHSVEIIIGILFAIICLCLYVWWISKNPSQDYNSVSYSAHNTVFATSAMVSGVRAEPSQITISTTSVTTRTHLNSATTNAHTWEHFVKPSQSTLHRQLTAIQYSVTQQDGTEQPFNNAYFNNEQAGIYVDIVSGEPLYSSRDKYDSGTGWPSFVKPISPEAVTYKSDSALFEARTEVRSSIANSHLGHIFDDGPADRGGKRYCMNSAALRFIPLADMVHEGYGDYVSSI